MLTQKYESSALASISLRLLIAIWALMALILGSTYVNLVISKKVVLSNNLPYTNFESFVQCLEQKRCRVITHDATMTSYQQVIIPGATWTDRINKVLIDNPAIIAPAENIPEIILQQRDYCLVWPWTKDNMLCNIKEDICLFYIANTPFKISNTFAMRKNSSTLHFFNRLGLYVRETGLAEGVRLKYQKFDVLRSE